MATPRSPKVLCVPINSQRIGSNASSAVVGARNAAQGYRRVRQRQLRKARGQLAKQGGISAQAQQGLMFRTANLIQGQGLTAPYKLLDAAALNDAFKTTSSSETFDDTFIQELFGLNRKADLVVYSKRSGSASVPDTFEFAINSASKVNLTGLLGGVDANSDDGSWLLYFNLSSGKVLPTLKVLCVRFGDAPADIQRAVSKGFDIKKIVTREPVRVHFAPRPAGNVLSLSTKNAWKFFNIPKVTTIVDARINATYPVPARMITEGAFTFKPVAERPYGPDFNAIRPPGTDTNFDYAVLADGASKRDVINFYNKILRECWTAIRDSLNGADRDKFLAHYPKAASLSLPRGAFYTQSAELWGRTAALANSIYEVTPLSFDKRPDAQGRPQTSIPDPGPFGTNRGLLVDGTSLVDSSIRPKGKKFDNRYGGLVVLHEDERASINLQNVAIGPLANRVFDASKVPDSFTKLEHVVRLRVKYASDLMYGPYNDYATIAALFRVELGQALFDAYADDPATMLDTLTSTSINNILNRHNSIFKEAWGSLAIRVVMGSKYSEVADLPHFSDTGQHPDNADRLLPFKAPSRDDRLVAYSDIYDVDVNGAEIRNFARADVHGFDFGDRARFRVVPAKRIVIHWGGTQVGYQAEDGGAIAAMLSNTKHSASTHFTLNHEGTVINQHAELAATTNHAAGFNFDSVGVDIPNIGAILAKYKQSMTDGYVRIGYSLIDVPFYRTGGALGKMLISPINQYETMYQLIEKLCALRNPPAGVHTDQLLFDPEPTGFFDVNGESAVTISSLVGARGSRTFSDMQDTGGVYCHLHLATNGKTDGIDGYIYYTLRYKLGVDSPTAYRRMQLTLQGDVKQTSDGVKYLILRS